MSRPRRRLLGTLLVCLSCSPAPDRVLLEPEERVIGRVTNAERVRLLTTRNRMLTVDLSDLSMTSFDITGLTDTDEAWGLGISSDGRLWTLVGPSRLAHLADGGRVGERLALGSNYVGLFSVDGEILLQPASVVPGDLVLQRLDLDAMTLRETGSLRAVEFATRAETLARNLIGCGSGRGQEIPCWFNQAGLVDRVSSGGGRQQKLTGVGLPEGVGRNSEWLDVPGPIVDVHIDLSGWLWALVRRADRAGVEEFVIARYAPDGRLFGVGIVPNRPRLILGARESRCVVLAGTGQLSTVTVG